MKLANERGKIILVVFSLSILLFTLFVPASESSVDLISRMDIVAPSEGFGIIVIDYSHGQESSNPLVMDDDALLQLELETMGYTVVWATGGLNSSILSTADGLVLGAISHEDNVFLTSEITAISDWFNTGSKLLWVGCDSDYTSDSLAGQFINDNMAAVLESVNSHVYPEPTSVEDPESNAGAAFRAVANQTSDDAYVSDIVMGVETVLMHSPTLLYGSNNTNFPGVGTDPVALEDTPIMNVYPLLYYSDFATIIDSDVTSPIAHGEGNTGAFVAATIEINAGASDEGTIIVSGASPYGYYLPMHLDDYNGNWNGSVFVKQAIDFGMQLRAPTIFDSPDVTYEEGQEIHSLFDNISWYPNSPLPKCYNLTLDDTPIRNGLWNTTNDVISINIEGHSAGEYNYTLTVENTLNLTASDSIIVTVLAPAAPVVNHPENITYAEGETGNIIQWMISDTSFRNFGVYQNGVSLGTTADAIGLGPTTWPIDVWVDGYAIGIHNLTVFITDWVGLVSSDTVWVEVLEAATTTTTTTTTTTDISDPTTTTSTTSTSDTSTTTTETGNGDLLSNITIIISIGSIVIIVIVIVLIKRKT